jgi:hypothetical protein
MTRELTRHIRLSHRWRVVPEFKLADMWIGVYWADHGGYVDIWVCLLPCLPLHFWTEER